MRPGVRVKETRMLKKGVGLREEQVRWAKLQLIAGASQSIVARTLGVSTNTIGRVARGETHLGVKVPGEEKLRVGLLTPPGDREGMFQDRGLQPVGPPVTEADVEASLQRLVALGVAVPGKEAPLAASTEGLGEGAKSELHKLFPGTF